MLPPFFITFCHFRLEIFSAESNTDAWLLPRAL